MPPGEGPARPGRGRRAAARLLFFAFLWFVLTEGESGSWIVGGPTVLLAALASLALPSPASWRWRPAGAARFVPYFLRQSLRGGFDVSRRALDPRLPLQPALVRHPLRLPPGPWRIFFANTVNLLPGTLSAELEEDRIIVHVLDAGPDSLRELGEVEEKVADLFGIALPPAAAEAARG